MHIKRAALDTALAQLKDSNLIKEKKQGKKRDYQGRTYPPGFLDKLYANYNSTNGSVENYKNQTELPI